MFAEPLRHLGDEMTKRLAESDRFTPTSDFRRLAETDVVIVCVPTPLGPHQEPDLSYVHDAAQLIAAAPRDGQLLILESTTYPGTTRDEFLPRAIGGSSRELGVDVFVAYSPEREDPGSGSFTTSTIPKLVGGLDETSTRLATAVYARAIEKVVPVASAEVVTSLPSVTLPSAASRMSPLPALITEPSAIVIAPPWLPAASSARTVTFPEVLLMPLVASKVMF